MSKRPSIGPDTVVRRSRLAVKGEAVPATEIPNESPSAASVAEPSSAQPVSAPVHAAPAVAAPVAAPPPALPAGLAEELLGRLSERDHQIEHLRAELRQVEHKANRDKTEGLRERDRMAAELAAADATIDELRNRVAEQRRQLDHGQAELVRLADIHAQERQQLMEQYREECERIAALAGVVEVSEVPATAGNAFPRARRWWMFGETFQSRVNSPLETRNREPRGRKP